MNVEINHPNYSLIKSKEEGYFEEDAINPLPRAVMRPNSFVLLDGEWDFAIDPDNKGIGEAWYAGYNYTDIAHWPGSVEEHMEATQPTGVLWQNQIVVWYERSFPLPEKSDELNKDCTQLQLT